MTGARRAARSGADFHALVGETSQDALLLQQHFSEHWERPSSALRIAQGRYRQAVAELGRIDKTISHPHLHPTSMTKTNVDEL